MRLNGWYSIMIVVLISIPVGIALFGHDHDSHNHAPTVDFQVTTSTGTYMEPVTTTETPITTPETSKYDSYTHPLNGGERYTITLRSPITLTGNPISGEIECSNGYGTVTVVGSYDGTRGTHNQDVYGSRGIGYDGIPSSGITLEITDTLDRCWGWGTWK